MAKNEQTVTSDMDYLDDAAGTGYEGIRASDYAVPFLRVLQPNSPETIEGDPSYVPGAKPGIFLNSLTKELYGPSIELIPIKSDAIWLEYTPKVGDKRGAFQGKHSVGSIEVRGNPFDGMFRIDNGNEIKETMVFYCLVKDHERELPVAFSLTSSMIKHGKSWNSLIFTARLPSGKQAPYFGGYWKISLTLNQNDDGRWFNIGTKNVNASFVSFVSKEVFEIALSTRKMLESNSASADFKQIESESTVTSESNATDY